MTEAEQQQVGAGGAPKLGELLDRWLDYISPNRAAYTVDEYQRLTERTIKPALGSVRIDRLTPRQVDGSTVRSGRRASPVRPSTSVPTDALARLLGEHFAEVECSLLASTVVLQGPDPLVRHMLSSTAERPPQREAWT